MNTKVAFNNHQVDTFGFTGNINDGAEVAVNLHVLFFINKMPDCIYNAEIYLINL